ncbi:MAG TPA: energy-coupling factor transporter transmembrane component T, partial [Actinomycetaceae bacterium]|nr:energy-coupling factor transporter transmembrane component T [Actinomycetaceae bacterium]
TVGDPVLGAAVLLASGGVLASSGAWRFLRRVVVPILLLLTGLFVVQGLLVSWTQAAVGTSRIAACLALAWAVSLTTPVSEMLALLQRVLRPLRRVGVDTERIALMVMLAMRSIPLVMSAALQSEEARQARGLRTSLKSLVVPTMVRSVHIADGLGEAVLARGYGTEEPVDGRDEHDDVAEVGDVDDAVCDAAKVTDGNEDGERRQIAEATSEG